MNTEALQEEDPDNPLSSGKYSAPEIMSDDELEAISVPFGDSQRLKAIMDLHGVAVVTGVCDKVELEELQTAFHEDLLSLVDSDLVVTAPPSVQQAFKAFTEHGPRAFPSQTADLLTASAGFCLTRCLSQGSFAWRVRGHPRVHAAFGALFPKEGPLVTSLDATFFTPDGQSEATVNGFSAHVDQNQHDVRTQLADCPIYQGVLYVWPAAAPSSSTTVVWPGSHRTVWPRMMKDQGFEAPGRAGEHYSEIAMMHDKAQAYELAAGWASHARRVPVPGGGLLLWNSRTVHTGWRGGSRLAQTVCLEPASRRPQQERKAKLRLAALGLPSTHWASVGMQHDMCLQDPGYPGSTATGAAAEAGGTQATPSAGVLPLRAALRPWALKEEADLGALRELVEVEFGHCGMWSQPSSRSEADALLLEASVTEEAKMFL